MVGGEKSNGAEVRSYQLDIFGASKLNEFETVAEGEGEVFAFAGPHKRKIAFWGWSITAAQFPDGSWRVAKRFMCGTHGFSEGLNANDPPFPSKTEAVAYAASYIIHRLSREKPDAIVSASIKELREIVDGSNLTLDANPFLPEGSR